MNLFLKNEKEKSYKVLYYYNFAEILYNVHVYVCFCVCILIYVNYKFCD